MLVTLVTDCSTQLVMVDLPACLWCVSEIVGIVGMLMLVTLLTDMQVLSHCSTQLVTVDLPV